MGSRCHAESKIARKGVSNKGGEHGNEASKKPK
jgi:hypothetical protein